MWSLVTARKGLSEFVAIQRDDGTFVRPTELFQWSTMLELLDDWDNAQQTLRSVNLQSAPETLMDDLLPPVHFPRKVICAGVNYRRHIREMGGEVPGEGWVPFFFMKPPTTTVIGPRDEIRLHAAEELRYDWEAELAVVIGRGGRDIPVSDALQHVAGYCVTNDISARGRHKRETVPAPAFVFDWFSSKAIDQSLPLGPGITPAFCVSDPQDLRLQSWVNGELQQDESTADMICTVAELIAAASVTTTLEPGDVLATGTPSGVGAGRGLFLKPGDVVTTSIDGLGTLTNPVV